LRELVLILHFCKELEKAINVLLPYEMEQLKDGFFSFTLEKPELKAMPTYCSIIN
jgi:hypothetical protein